MYLVFCVGAERRENNDFLDRHLKNVLKPQSLFVGSINRNAVFESCMYSEYLLGWIAPAQPYQERWNLRHVLTVERGNLIFFFAIENILE